MKKREHSEILQTSELVTIEFDESGVHIDPQQTTVMRQKKKKKRKAKTYPGANDVPHGVKLCLSPPPLFAASPPRAR